MAMTELRKEIEAAAQAELDRANKNFHLFTSKHEAYAVTVEKVEEAKEALDDVIALMNIKWDTIRGKNIPEKIASKADNVKIYHQAINAACEMAQVAAMLLISEMSHPTT